MRFYVRLTVVRIFGFTALLCLLTLLFELGFDSSTAFVRISANQIPGTLALQNSTQSDAQFPEKAPSSDNLPSDIQVLNLASHAADPAKSFQFLPPSLGLRVHEQFSLLIATEDHKFILLRPPIS